MTNFLFKKISIIGIGLIGSSIARAIKYHNLAQHIAISSQTEDNSLQKAKELGLGDSYHETNEACVQDAELVILAIPVGAYRKVMQEISPFLKNDTILTDVGSTKASVISQILPSLPENIFFVPAHPIAGTEKSGPEHGFRELFINRWCIITPLENQQEKYQIAIKKLENFWTNCGSKVAHMTAAHHDKIFAIISHVPHLIAYSIVGTASDLETVTQSEVISYSASGFRDFTRLAASDPTMWRDICIHNKEAILEMLARFSEDLSALQRAIRWEDSETLFSLFSRTRKIRQSIIDAGQDTKAPDFGRQYLSNLPPK